METKEGELREEDVLIIFMIVNDKKVHEMDVEISHSFFFISKSYYTTCYKTWNLSFRIVMLGFVVVSKASR